MGGRQIEILEREGFTIVTNNLIKDSRLRLATRAVLILMLSKPKDWNFSVRGMASIAGVSTQTMSKMLDELIEAGYIARKEQGRARGRFGKGGYVVSGRPVFLADKPGEAPAKLERSELSGEPGDSRGARGRAAAQGQFTCPEANQMEGAPAKLERSELSGEGEPGDLPCPDFSYTKESHAKNSPQQKKEQAKTQQENPPASPQGEGEAVKAQGYPPELEEAVLRWLQYKRERREPYKPTGLKTLLKRTGQTAAQFGAGAVAEAIDTAMSANWQGIVWDKLKRPAPQEPMRRKLE